MNGCFPQNQRLKKSWHRLPDNGEASKTIPRRFSSRLSEAK
jgi:hypothetical protein